MAPRIKKLLTELQPLEPFHFIGIGGSGMAPLAQFLSAAGLCVTGSDTSQAQLDALNLPKTNLQLGHNPSPLVTNARTVVVSSAIHEGNLEVQAAHQLSKSILHRSELLALASNFFELITVSGTHGKSTTSALISYVLLKLGLEPSFVLGASLLLPDTAPASWRLGTGDYLVVEADESDGSFLRYRPKIAVVTNIDADHMDYYGSMEAMQDAFERHLKNISEEGFTVLFWDHDRVRAVAETTFTATRLTFGSFIGSEVRLTEFSQRGANQRFVAVVERDLCEVMLPLIGKHNATNALAALAVVRAIGKPISSAAAALSSFPGVARRLALHFQDPNMVIYDDYAHNPVKIASLLSGLRAAFPKSHITAVFQAHRYSRIKHLYHDLMSSFKSANEVLVVPVYAAGEAVLSDVTPSSIAQDISKLSLVKTTPCQSLKDALELLQLKAPVSHTVCVTIGAGDVWTVARDYAAHLSQTQ